MASNKVSEVKKLQTDRHSFSLSRAQPAAVNILKKTFATLELERRFSRQCHRTVIEMIRRRPSTAFEGEIDEKGKIVIGDSELRTERSLKRLQTDRRNFIKRVIAT